MIGAQVNSILTVDAVVALLTRTVVRPATCGVVDVQTVPAVETRRTAARPQVILTARAVVVAGQT